MRHKTKSILEKGDVAQHVLPREGHHLTELLAHLIRRIADPRKEPCEPLGCHVGGDAFRVVAFAGHFDGVLIDVGGEDLNGTGLLGFRELFQQNDSHRIRFLAGGTADAPDTDRRIRFLRADQGRDDVCLQSPPGFGIAEKARHIDQEIPGKMLDFLRMFFEEVEIVGQLLELLESHPAVDSAGEHLLAVQPKIELCAPSQ